MNQLISFVELPPVEREVAELYAWGFTKKEIANKRGKSFHTIDKQIRNLFAKTGARKDTEFSAWYFCSRFGISAAMSPLAKGIVSICLLMIIGFSILNDNNPMRSCRSSRARTARVVNVRGARRNDIS